MYKIENRYIFIGRIQKMLGIPITKRMDKVTEAALKKYRKTHGLSEEPIVDKALFDLLAFDKRYPPHPFEKLEIGKCSDEVFILNSILTFFIKHLGLFIRPPRGQYYTRETQNAITELKNHFPNIKNDRMFYHLLEYSFAILKSSFTTLPF